MLMYYQQGAAYHQRAGGGGGGQKQNLLWTQNVKMFFIIIENNLIVGQIGVATFSRLVLLVVFDPPCFTWHVCENVALLFRRILNFERNKPQPASSWWTEIITLYIFGNLHWGSDENKLEESCDNGLCEVKYLAETITSFV